jgi:hypothetical protein
VPLVLLDNSPPGLGKTTTDSVAIRLMGRWRRSITLEPTHGNTKEVLASRRRLGVQNVERWPELKAETCLRYEEAVEVQESRPYDHQYSPISNVDLADVSDEERRAAFWRMSQRGGGVSRDAKEASDRAFSDGRGRDHRVAAAAHRDAAEHHEGEGNRELADDHREAARYHAKQARLARNDSPKGHLEGAPRQQVKAAFAAMSDEGLALSKDARRASRAAADSGSARAHRAAARAHAEARDFHRDEGNDELARSHQDSVRYHTRHAYHAGKRGRSGVANVAAACSAKADGDGSLLSHRDAVAVHTLAAANALMEGDTAAALEHNQAAEHHGRVVARLSGSSAAHARGLTRNDVPPPPIYVGRAGVPPDFTGYPGLDLTFNYAGLVGDGSDFLPVPRIDYREWSENDITANRRHSPVRNEEAGTDPHWPDMPLMLPTLWGY